LTHETGCFRVEKKRRNSILNLIKKYPKDFNILSPETEEGEYFSINKSIDIQELITFWISNLNTLNQKKIIKNSGQFQKEFQIKLTLILSNS